MKTRTGLIFLALCAAGLPGVAEKPPSLRVPLTQATSAQSVSEAEQIRAWSSQAVPLTQDELRPLDNVQIPPSCDYSKYVTFIRCQGSGGCGTMATLSILDILKEKERPYSPDFSYRFAEYIYNLPNSGRDQFKVLKDSGCCSETSLPSQYASPGPFTPTTADYNEAKMYRIASSTKPKKPSSVDDLKRLLFVNGPLFASGDTPGSATHGHCFAIIGYDDATQMFTIVNSFGDRWGVNGMMKMPYANIKNPPATQSSPRLDAFSYAVNLTTPYYAHPYTGRIRIQGNTLRRNLTVKLGVEGRTPMVVWDRPNKTGPINDDSTDLALDFPLPSYAAQRWPPSAKNQWYLEVSEDFPTLRTTTAAVVQEISLVKRLVAGNGSCTPIVIHPSSKDFAVPYGATVKIYIPTRESFTLSLSASPASVAKGSAAKFSGTLTCKLEFSSSDQRSVPQATRDIEVRRATRDPIEGTVVWNTIGTARTDTQGRFTLNYAPDATSDYQAFASKPDGTVQAASNLVTVSVNSGTAPTLKPMPKIIRPLP